jgi:hypothetical protein
LTKLARRALVLLAPLIFGARWTVVKVGVQSRAGLIQALIKDFGPAFDSNDKQLTPQAYGIIEGDLTHLFVKTDSGMFLSTDEGLTWRNIGGPPYFDNSYVAAHGVTYVTEIVGGQPHTSGDIWEYDWDQASVETNSVLQSSISVYPNPSTDFVHIVDVPESINSVTLYDLLGREYHVPIDAGTLDVRSLMPGNYLVRVANGWTGKTVKFVKE